MRPSGSSVWIPVGAVLDGMLILVGFLLTAQALLVIALLVNPRNDLREYFQVQTMATVPASVWPTDGLVRVAADYASVAAVPIVSMDFRPASRGFVLAASAASFTWWACVVVVLVQLRGVLRNLPSRTPFPRDNIRRIRVIGWTILAAAMVSLLIDLVAVALMRVAVTVAGRPAEVPLPLLVAEFPLGTLLAGLAVILLAEIFRAGADLQDDQALTI
jgi:hypothetical protein